MMPRLHALATPFAKQAAFRMQPTSDWTALARMAKTAVAGLSLLGLLVATPGAKADTPAPAGGKPTAVRIVCLAESEDSFLKERDAYALHWLRFLAGIADGDDKDKSVSAKLREILKTEYPPVGGWHYLPIGTGFIVDAERMHVVTNWHVALGCRRNANAKMQIGILEGVGNEIEPILADVLDRRIVRNERGENAEEIVKIGTLCRNREQKCTQTSPNNVEFFAPDIAILRLQRKAQTAPIPLAPNLPIDGKTELQLAGFPQVAMQLAQGNGSPRRQAVTMTMTPGKYSNQFSRNNIRPGLAREDIVNADFMMLAAQVHPGNSGGPVLAGDQVVGIVTASLMLSSDGHTAGMTGTDVSLTGQEKNIIPAGFALAVKVNELVKVLDWFNVKPVRFEAPKPPVPGIEPPPPPKVVQPWWMDRQNQVLAGLAMCLAIAGAAFAMIKPRPVPRRIEPATDRQVDMNATHGAGLNNIPPVQTPTSAPVQPPTLAAVALHATHGPLNGQAFPLPTPNGGMALMVGRNPQTCQVVFPNDATMVSRLHCSFVWNASAKTLIVEDLGSTEGTFVNGKRIAKNEKTTLNAGDTVDLGGVTINRFSVSRT